MAKPSVKTVVKTATTRPRSARKSAPALTASAPPAFEVALRVDEDRIRERAYGIWIAEGRPHGCEDAHWQRAQHELRAAQ